MSTILHSTTTVRHGMHSVGEVWNRLQGERENICDALLTSSQPKLANAKRRKSQINSGAMWHREMLQARLRKIDDALDRLISGSYGNCCKCGRWIEDTKLNFDPAIAFCIDCWERQQSRN